MSARTSIGVALLLAAACGGSSAEGRAIGSSSRPEPRPARPVLEPSGPEPSPETVAEPAEPASPEPPPRTGPLRLAASAHPPADRRWLPEAARGAKCTIRGWGSPEARNDSPRSPDVTVEYTFASGRISKVRSVNDAAAFSWTETRRLMPNGRIAGALVAILESPSGPSRVRSTFSYRVPTDGGGRVVEEIATTPDGPQTTRVTYGEDGRPAEIDRPSPTSDGRDQIECTYTGEIPTRIVFRGPAPRTVSFEPDEAGNVIGMHVTHPEGFSSTVITRESPTVIVATELNERNEPANVTSYEGACTEVIFDPCSRLFVPPPPAAPRPGT